MKSSKLFRPDQYSYLLYPYKELKGFIERNTISAVAISTSKLLQQLVADETVQILEKDVNGAYHFNGNFKNANDLKAAWKNFPNRLTQN
jgi:NADPH-dependent curcumin reductase CurA